MDAPPPTNPASTPAVPSATQVNLRFAGTIHCAAFPYGCSPTLSVLAPGTVIADTWRTRSSDPFWVPDYSQGGTADHFEPTSIGVVPRLSVGRHELVISLLGSYDTPSYLPDGSRALDLLGRCSEEVDVQPGSAPLDVVVTFVPNPGNFQVTCTIVLTPS